MARVCMVAYTHYSTDSRVRREAESLVERGDAVDFICLGGEHERGIVYFSGVRLIKINVGRYRGASALMYLASYLQFFFVVMFKLVGLQIKNRYQVIQVHTMPDFMVFAAVFPKLMGAKVVLDVHDLMPELFQSKFGYAESHPLIRFIRWMEVKSVDFADRAIAVHGPHLDALCQHGNAPGKFSILLNLPDAKIFSNADGRLAEDGLDFKLIYHGTVSRRHGLETAIRAIAILKEQINNLVFEIFGDGDDILRLADVVDTLGLEERVRIHRGMLPMEKLIPVINNADVGVVPILYDDFTKYMLPTKLLEYVALGKPVICSRTKTIEAYFDDSMVQYVEPGKADELAKSIRFLYEDPDYRKALVAKADKFNREHNWGKQKLMFYQLIDSLIENGQFD